MKTATQKHLDAIASGEVCQTNIVGMRKILNHVARLRKGYSAHRSNATLADGRAIEKALAACSPMVVGDLHQSGLERLRAPRYAKRWNDAQRAIIRNEPNFYLVWFDWIDPLHCVPVYCVQSPGGQSFLFRNIPWQSGGDGPEVLEG